MIFGFRTNSPSAQGASGLGRDVLLGIDAGAGFHPNDGFDFVTDGAGTDTFFFDDQVGQRDILRIPNFDPVSDQLDLGEATIAKTFEGEDRTILQLEGADCDRIVLLGLSETPFDLLN